MRERILKHLKKRYKHEIFSNQIEIDDLRDLIEEIESGGLLEKTVYLMQSGPKDVIRSLNIEDWGMYQDMKQKLENSKLAYEDLARRYQQQCKADLQSLKPTTNCWRSECTKKECDQLVHYLDEGEEFPKGHFDFFESAKYNQLRERNNDLKMINDQLTDIIQGYREVVQRLRDEKDRQENLEETFPFPKFGPPHDLHRNLAAEEFRPIFKKIFDHYTEISVYRFDFHHVLDDLIQALKDGV